MLLGGPDCCLKTGRYADPYAIFKGISDLASKTNPFTFLQQVRAEVSKVVWPTRRETGVTTAMTLVLVFITAVFFFLVDQVLSYGTGFLFG